MILSQMMIDFLLALGGLIGLATKLYALLDEQTIWSRRSSGFNTLSYPFTALLPFAALGLPFTFLTSFCNFLVWVGIFIYRAPEDEDWLGREKT
jgi:hypothetical protein